MDCGLAALINNPPKLTHGVRGRRVKRRRLCVKLAVGSDTSDLWLCARPPANARAPKELSPPATPGQGRPPVRLRTGVTLRRRHH